MRRAVGTHMLSLWKWETEEHREKDFRFYRWEGWDAGDNCVENKTNGNKNSTRMTWVLCVPTWLYIDDVDVAECTEFENGLKWKKGLWNNPLEIECILLSQNGL